MNPWQLTQQLQHLLETVKWTSGTKQVVFGTTGVHVYAGTPPTDEEYPPAFPFCLVTLDSSTPDIDSPDLVDQQLTVVVAVKSSGDALGEHAIIGGPRSNLGSSQGAGLAEVAERVTAAIGDLTGYDGAATIVSSTNASAPQPLGRGKHVAFQQITVTAMCTSEPVFTAPQQIKLTGSDWTWEGNNCQQRYDFLQYRFGYVTGSTAVDLPDDLTSVLYTGTTPTFTHTATEGRVYQVFADYSPRSTGTVAYTSTGQLGSYKAT